MSKAWSVSCTQILGLSLHLLIIINSSFCFIYILLVFQKCGWNLAVQSFTWWLCQWYQKVECNVTWLQVFSAPGSISVICWSHLFGSCPAPTMCPFLSFIQTQSMRRGGSERLFLCEKRWMFILTTVFVYCLDKKSYNLLFHSLSHLKEIY